VQIAGGIAGYAEAIAGHEFVQDPVSDAHDSVRPEGGADFRIVPVDSPNQFPHAFAFHVLPKARLSNHAANKAPNDWEMAHEDSVSDAAVLIECSGFLHGGEKAIRLLWRQHCIGGIKA
jgi:hypothetical protein